MTLFQKQFHHYLSLFGKVAGGLKGAKKGCSDWNTLLNNPPGLMYAAY
jgi:hypothetical protein